MLNTQVGWSGIAFMVAGVLFSTFMFFHPSNDAQGALNPLWTPIHVMWFVSYLLILLGLNGLSKYLTNGVGRFGIAAYLISFLGTALSLPIAVWDSFIVPYLAVHAPEMIEQIEELSQETPVLVFRITFFLTVITFSLGFMLLGISIMRRNALILSRVMGGLLVIGAPLFWIGAIAFSKGSLGNLITIIGAVSFGIGLVLLGYSLQQKKLTFSALI
jgi:hypothetical protein